MAEEDRIVMDSQPQFMLVWKGRKFVSWARTQVELDEEASTIAMRLGVPVSELQGQFRVMITLTTSWLPVGEQIDWDEVRETWQEWAPPEDASVPIWDGQPYV